MKADEIQGQNDYQTSYQNTIEENKFTAIDFRQQLTNLNRYPYNTIGRITSKKQYIHKGIKKQAEKIGIGCLIHPRIVLTVAHVIYFDMLAMYSGVAENISFFHLNKGRKIKVKQWKFNQKYLNKQNFDTDIYDVAILILQEEADIKENQVMVMDDSYHFSNTELQMITVLTIKDNQLNLYVQKNTITKFTPSKMFYLHTTKSGDSGCPILIHSNGRTVLVGLHRACTPKLNYGVIIQTLLKQNNFLEEILEQYKIKTKQELRQQYQQNTIQLRLQQKVKQNSLSTVIEQANIVQKQNFNLQKVLQDPIQFIRIYQKNIKFHKKNQNGNVISLWLNDKSQLDVKDFYQYDWSKLEELQFRNCLKIKQNLKLFFQMSILLPSLMSLEINQMKMQFKDEGIYELVKCKKTGSFKQLTSLKLQYNNITANGLKQFAENADQFNLLQQLKFYGDKVDEQGMISLSICADKWPKLKQLSLRFCQIGLKEMKTLSENAQKFKNIQILWLSQNKIGDKQFAEFCKHAHKLLNLQHLNLDGNKIGDEGWRALVKYAHNFNKLKKIELSQNKIEQINEGDLDKFQNVEYLQFDGLFSYSPHFSQHSIKVLEKYAKQHKNNGITVFFSNNYKQPSGWVQKSMKYLGSIF